MLNHSVRGSTLIEVLIAAAIGALVIMAVQQQLQWQAGLRYQHVSQAAFLLNAQATANQLFETLQNTVITQLSNPAQSCYLFSQQNGGSIGFRVRNNQLQHNSMTLNCTGYGWQSITDRSQFKVTQFTAHSYLPDSGSGLSKLFVTLTVTRGEQTQVFTRLITLNPS
ncbi:MAG: prepilin-type N-terminal cleavage/methylation domain-containing protein [Pseudomonadota bacterium]